MNHQLLENFREAAKETGGELCLNSLVPQTCAQRIEDDATSYYLLSYETHSQSTRPEWRNIRVKLDRGGLFVSAHTGVLIDPTLTTAEKKREQIASALFSPVDLPGLLFEVQISPAVDARQLRSLSVVVRADVTHPGVWNANGADFTVASLVFDRSNKEQYFGGHSRPTVSENRFESGRFHFALDSHIGHPQKCDGSSSSRSGQCNWPHRQHYKTVVRVRRKLALRGARC